MSSEKLIETLTPEIMTAHLVLWDLFEPHPPNKQLHTDVVVALAESTETGPSVVLEKILHFLNEHNISLECLHTTKEKVREKIESIHSL